jgi:hypothetical protein
MIAGGFALGLLGERRPFGETVLGHPVVVFCGVAGAGLLIIRFALGRPVPEVIPERAIAVGFLTGIAACLRQLVGRASDRGPLTKHLPNALACCESAGSDAGRTCEVNAIATLIGQ